jgi:hypothetical protein
LKPWDRRRKSQGEIMRHLINGAKPQHISKDMSMWEPFYTTELHKRVIVFLNKQGRTGLDFRSLGK